MSFVKKLDFDIGITDIEAQNIDNNRFDTFGIIIAFFYNKKQI